MFLLYDTIIRSAEAFCRYSINHGLKAMAIDVYILTSG